MGRGGTEWSVGCGPNGQSLISNCVVLGARRLHEPIEGKRRAQLPQKVSANLPLVCPHHGENAHKWSVETLPDVALNGKRVLMEGSGRVPDQWGQGPGGTSQRPCVQLSPECDTVASASLPLINKGRAGRDRNRQMLRGLWQGPRCANPPTGHSVFCSGTGYTTEHDFLLKTDKCKSKPT